MDVKRLDLGADIVVLPDRDLMVLHPNLGYADSLGAVMGTLPDLHPDAAVSLVEQVTPRPQPEPEPRPRTRWRRTLAVLVTTAVLLLFPVLTLHPASADPEFGPDWQAAVESLDLTCHGTGSQQRLCHSGEGRFAMRGYRHKDGSLYVAVGEHYAYTIFVFDERRRADQYAEHHPDAIQQGRAVVW